jgi:hypothetical protein
VYQAANCLQFPTPCYSIDCFVSFAVVLFIPPLNGSVNKCKLTRHANHPNVATLNLVIGLLQRECWLQMQTLNLRQCAVWQNLLLAPSLLLWLVPQ